MKYWFIIFLCISSSCLAQKWETEIMLGVSAYNGDLTQQIISPKTMKPAVGFALKYNLGDVVLLRGGISWGRISASDKNNKHAELRARNLNFTTDILEGSLCVEVNLFEPEFFQAYPYVFAGAGIFHFNPYTYDGNHVKQYLQPLGTEGQGLAAYPDRKPYALTQFCLPFGGGMKIKLNERWDIIYEFGGRFLFTDYLDDVSKTYVNTQAFLSNSRPKAAELAYRQAVGAVPNEGDIRGNPKIKDWYFISGFKLLLRLGKSE
jgi:hypothetical protein